MSSGTALVYLPVYNQEEIEIIYERNFKYIAKIVDYIIKKYDCNLKKSEINIRNLGVSRREYLDTICLSLYDIHDTYHDLIAKGVPYDVIIARIPIYKKDMLVFSLVFNFSLPEANYTPHYLFKNTINFSLLEVTEFVEMSTNDADFSDILIEKFKNEIIDFLEKRENNSKRII